MVYTINNRWKHVLTPNHKLNIQSNFVFVDTETNIIKINSKITKQIFKLGYAYFWNRKLNIRKKYPIFQIKEFWNKIESKFNDDNKELYLYAHNCQFDFKILNGFKELIIRNWKLINFYVKNSIFSLTFKKDNYTLYIYDTMNYVKKSVKQLGISINLPKLNIDFNKCTFHELLIYCKRDTKIIYKFVKELTYFLEQYQITKLKSTAGSMSFNGFRHKFYKYYKPYKKEFNCRNIIIHNWIKVDKLERESYRGGITECFNLNPNLETYKTDINSMYPYIMKKYRFPIRLIDYKHESNHSNKELINWYNQWKNYKYSTIIAKASILIPKENAYILGNFGLGKNSFCYSDTISIKLTLCLPELKFIEQFGKIIKIHEIALYYTKYIFKRFIRFFYNKRIEAKKENNLAYIEMCKLFMNTLYGKFGQYKIDYKIMTYNDEFISKNVDIIREMIKKRIQESNDISFMKYFCYLGTINNKYELYIIHEKNEQNELIAKLVRIKQTKNSSFNSFIAISSLITSYSRMLLIKYLKIAKRENVYYCDTDSLFVNKKGYNNLKKNHLIDNYKLGALKKEGKGICTIYAPKFYDFNDIRKAKGIKKNSILISENKEKAIYQNEIWQKFKTDLKKGNLSEQIITLSTKEIMKKYDKGKILDTNLIEPYSYQEIKMII